MPKRSSKRPRDPNQLAKIIIDLATKSSAEPARHPPPRPRKKNRKRPA